MIAKYLIFFTFELDFCSWNLDAKIYDTAREYSALSNLWQKFWNWLLHFQHGIMVIHKATINEWFEEMKVKEFKWLVQILKHL